MLQLQLPLHILGCQYQRRGDGFLLLAQEAIVRCISKLRLSSAKACIVTPGRRP